MYNLFKFSLNPTKKFNHFLVTVRNVFMRGLHIVNTPCCSHMSTYDTCDKNTRHRQQTKP